MSVLCELRDGVGLQQLVAGHRQLAAQVEQLVLDGDEQRAHVARQRFGQQHADLRVEFIDVAHGLDAQVVLWHAGAVAQAGGAVVAGAGGDLCESVAHGGGVLLFSGSLGRDS